MFSKIALAALVVATLAQTQIPADIKAKIDAKIATLSPDAQKYAQKFMDAYQSANGDKQTAFNNIKAVKDELKSDPNAAAIKQELQSVMPKPGPLTDEQKQQIQTIIKGLSPAAQSVADQIQQVIQGSSDDKFEEIYDILAAVTDPSVKSELETAKQQIVAVLPKPDVSAQ